MGDLCRYDYAPFSSSIPASERVSFMYMGKFEINDDLRAFIDLNGQNSKTTIRGAGSPSFNELFMSGDNINHPFADDPTHPFYQQDLTMRRRTVEIGNREKRVDSDYYRTVIGLEGGSVTGIGNSLTVILKAIQLKEVLMAFLIRDAHKKP